MECKKTDVSNEVSSSFLNDVEMTFLIAKIISFDLTCSKVTVIYIDNYKLYATK